MTAPESPLTPLSEEEQVELERLAGEATPGPWHTNTGDTQFGTWWRVEYDADGLNKGARFVIGAMNATEGGVPRDAANAAFIAAARDALPRALATIRSQAGRLGELAAALDTEEHLHEAQCSETLAERVRAEAAESRAAAAEAMVERLRAALAELGPRPHAGHCWVSKMSRAGGLMAPSMQCSCDAGPHNARVQAALAAQGTQPEPEEKP